MRRIAAKALRTSFQCTVRSLARINRPRRSALYLQHHHYNRNHHHYYHQQGHQHQPSNNTTTTTATSTSSSAPSLGPGPGARSFSTSHSLALSTRNPLPQYVLTEPLRSSMYIRRYAIALASGLVGYGAWYTYKGEASPNQAVGNAYSTTTPKPPSGDAMPTRNVLVVGADELHTGTFVGDGPIAKSADGTGHNVLEMLTPEQATEKLRKNQTSFLVNRGQGVLRYDIVQLASNNPIEDDHAEKIVEVPPSSTGEGSGKGNNDWMFWGVFDGHAGWTTSARLRQSLISFVARELNTTYKAAHSLGAPPSAQAIDKAIKTGFLRLDDEIVNRSVEKVLKSNSKSVAAEMLGPALSGSCALLSFYDSISKTLRVACTGDSRAVLGRRNDAGKWVAQPLSEDQTGSNPREVARMRSEHPGEDRVIHNGRVLGGLEPTRAFGDSSYKWSKEISERLRSSFFGRTASPHLKTPPYVTAEPVVTSTKIQPDKGDFVVLATDGLWEMLSNEEVVGLVGKWIESEAAQQSGSSSQLGSLWAKIFGGTGKGLPVEHAKSADPDGQKTPIRQRQWGLKPDEERFVVKDKNVATHLIRNALGGRNEEQVCALLTLVSPFSRRYRDDLTVQVIFFGNGEKTGEVLLNEEATTPPRAAVGAKL